MNKSDTVPVVREGIVLCVDFDGTVVSHEYPEVGLEVPHAVRVLQRLVDSGCRIILWTMRSGDYLQDAVQWFEERDIPLFGINNNPEQAEWTDSPKAYGQIYIDDAACGCPLQTHPTLNARPMVDWLQIERLLVAREILKQ